MSNFFCSGYSFKIFALKGQITARELDKGFAEVILEIVIEGIKIFIQLSF